MNHRDAPAGMICVERLPQPPAVAERAGSRAKNSRPLGSSRTVRWPLSAVCVSMSVELALNCCRPMLEDCSYVGADDRTSTRCNAQHGRARAQAVHCARRSFSDGEQGSHARRDLLHKAERWAGWMRDSQLYRRITDLHESRQG